MRDALNRLRYVLGIPSAVVFVALAFSNTAMALALEVIPGVWGKVAWTGVLGAVLVALFHQWDTKHRLELTSSTMGQVGTAKLAKRRGAVIVLGLEAGDIDGSVARLLKEAASLEWLAFVGTPQTAERKVVQDIREKLLPLVGRNVAASRIRVWEYADAENLAQNEQSVSEAIRWMLEEGLTPADLVVDITNGRRPMHLGAYSAAELHEVETQYLAPLWDHAANQSVKGKEAFKVVVVHHDEQEVGR